MADCSNGISYGEEDEWDEDEWEEDSAEEQETVLEASPTPCLFCDRHFEAGPLAVLDHCSQDHHFQLTDYVSRLGLDFYSYVKLINYIRKEHPEPSELSLATSPYPWLPDYYLTPVLQEDPMLQLILDEEEEMSMSTVQGGTSSNSSSTGSISDTTPSQPSLQTRLNDANAMICQFQDALSRAREDLENMRRAVQELVKEKGGGGGGGGAGGAGGRRAGGGRRGGRKRGGEILLSKEADKWGPEEPYFEAYTNYKIHEQMLKDEARTVAYQAFIEKNPRLFKDKVVLDIGCGTAILSLFAAAAGAKLVIGVDKSNIIYKAMDIVRENGYEDRITLIKGKVEDITLPVEKVDVIISEWMGYFLLYESMLDTVLYARDKWLINPKNVFPNKCSISLVAMGNRRRWESKVQYWKDVYGFKMSCIRSDALKEPSVEGVNPGSIISSPDVFKKFDVSKVTPGELEFIAPFSLKIQKDTECHGIVGYFDAEFKGEEYSLVMKTGPRHMTTHWQQIVFFLEEPIKVTKNDVLKGTVNCKKDIKYPRALDITIHCTLESAALVATANALAIQFRQKFTLD